MARTSGQGSGPASEPSPMFDTGGDNTTGKDARSILNMISLLRILLKLNLAALNGLSRGVQGASKLISKALMSFRFCCQCSELYCATKPRLPAKRLNRKSAKFVLKGPAKIWSVEGW